MNDNYKQVLNLLLSSRYDDISTKNEKYAKQLTSVHEEFVARNKELTSLLSGYIAQREKRVRTNSFFKKFLFWTFIGLLILLTLTIIIVFIKVDYNNMDVSSIVSLLSVVATYLTSILSIFKIMSKYLFPADEEKDTITMITSVLSNDLKVEEIMTKAIDNNNNSDFNTLQKYKELFDSQVITNEEFEKLRNKIISKYID